MTERDRVFYTVTMAKMQAGQGNLSRAAEIYRYLLRREPDRDDLAEALAEVEDELRNKDPYDLVGIVSEWAEQVVQLGLHRRLTAMRAALRSHRRAR